MKTTDNPQLREALLQVLEKNIGSITADKYRSFYNDKDTAIVISSVSELLLELLGELKSKEIMTKILATYPVSGAI